VESIRSPRSIGRVNGSHEVRYIPPRLFAPCGLACGETRLGASGWEGEISGHFEHPAGYSDWGEN
jgi:hypothetical protein